MKRLKTFNADDIIDGYRIDELMTIEMSEERKVFDFLPSVSLGDKDLRKWQDYFIERCVPWAITKNGNGSLTLWKEKYTND